MRAALGLTLLLAMSLLAGCLAPQEDTIDPTPSEADRDAERALYLDDHPTFCDEEEACDFWDDEYHQYVVYDLDTFEFDVIVVPGATADPLVHTAAAKQGVEAWRDGILELAEPWLQEAFRLDVYVLGEDIIPPEVLANPQIVVLLGGVTTTLVGIGLEPKQLACIILEEMGDEQLQKAVSHSGWARVRADCTGLSFTCFAINVSGALGEERDVYDLVAHEVGHCLGAGHVGDALDFRARYAPPPDIMSYDFNPEQVGCVSNMNVRTLEGVYGHLLGRPESEWLPRGSFYHMDPLDYVQVECANPASE